MGTNCFIITFDVQTLNHDVHNRATTSFDFTKDDYDSLCYFFRNSDFTPCLDSHNIEQVWCNIRDFIKDNLSNLYIENVIS